MYHVRPFMPCDGDVKVSPAALAGLVRDAGTAGFIDSLLDFCRRSVGADFVSVFSLARSGAPELVGTATTTGEHNAQRALCGYMSYYASDVNFTLMSDVSPAAHLTYQAASEIRFPAYRRACYDRTGIADRFSYVRTRSGASLSVSVYRSRDSGCFSERDLDRTAALLPILVACVDRHWGLARDEGGSLAEVEAHFRNRYPALTARECEVAARAKAGMSAAEIARDLGIAETTVISHRKSAYARMGVTNLRQLLRSS